MTEEMQRQIRDAAATRTAVRLPGAAKEFDQIRRLAMSLSSAHLQHRVVTDGQDVLITFTTTLIRFSLRLPCWSVHPPETHRCSPNAPQMKPPRRLRNHESG